MNQFIELTFANGYKTFVRTSAVVAVYSKKDGAMLDIGRNIEYAVQETPEEVLEKMRAAEAPYGIMSHFDPSAYVSVLEPAAEPADIEPDD